MTTTPKSPRDDLLTSPSPGDGPAPPGQASSKEDTLVVRILFWIILLYALGLALMVIEDLVNHTYLM
jgi:hypothetical protein